MRSYLFILLLFPCSVVAQTLASREPRNRTVLLEMFTGINCGNCPAAHVVAHDIAAAHPGEVTLVGLHGGPLANPSAGQPDFRTQWTPVLLGHFGFTATPQGMVNRQGVTAPTGWANAIAQQLALPSPVNIGLASRFDPGTRLLTVDVELYHTANGTDGNDRIHALLVEDGITGWQTDYINGNHTAYSHSEVLRAYITDLWGDEVTTSGAGDGVLRTYTLTVPPEWDIARCRVVAFVGEYQARVHQARNVAAVGGTTAIEGPDGTGGVGVGPASPVPATDRATIPLYGVAPGAVFQLRDAVGRPLIEERLVPGQTLLHLPVGHLANGTYLYGVAGGLMRSLVVSR